MPSKVLVLNYAVNKKIEPFFTGGPLTASQNGEFLFAPCGTSVKVIRTASGEVVSSIESGDGTEVTCLCLTPDESQLIISYRNLLIRQFSLIDFSVQRTWKSGHRAPILCMLFDKESGILATGSADYSIRIWNTQNQVCTHNLKGSAGIVTSLAFCRDSKEKRFLYVGNVEGEICLWDLDTIGISERCVVKLKPGLGNAVVSLIVKQRSLISADRGQTIRVWDRKHHDEVRMIKCGESLEWITPFEATKTQKVVSRETIKKLKSESGKYPNFVLGGGPDGQLKLFDVESGRLVWTSEKKNLYDNSVGFQQVVHCPAANGQLYLVVTVEHNILMVDGQTLNVRSQLVGYNDEILSSAYLGDDERFLVLGTNSADIRLYDAESLSCRLLSGHSDHVLFLTKSLWNTKLFASASKDNSIRLWQLSEETHSPSAECVAIATGHTASVTAVKFARSGSKFLVSVSQDKTLKLWGLNNLGEAKKLTSSVTIVAHDQEITCVDVSPNDRIVATGSMDKMVKLWKVTETKKSLFSLEACGKITGNKRGVWDIAFSPVDQAIATACGDTNVNIFSLTDFTCVKTFEGHDSAVLQVKFLPTGHQLLSGDSGGLVKLWNIKNNECMKTFDAHDGKVWTVLVSKDGEKIVSGGGDGTVLCWRNVTEEDKAAEAQKGTELMEKEQNLSNLLKQKKLGAALVMAVKLAKPSNALRVITEIVANSGKMELNSAIKQLRMDEVCTLLGFVVEWNTNSRNSHLAQCVLSEIFKIFTPEELMKLPDIGDIVIGLLPYSERHFDRLSRMKQNASFLDYTWQCMRIGGDFQELSLESGIDDRSIV